MNRDSSLKPGVAAKSALKDEEYFVASSWQLMRRKFLKNKLAILGGSVLAVLYIVGALFPGFFSTADVAVRNADYGFVPPQRIRIFHEGKIRLPFVYGLEVKINPESRRRTYTEDRKTVFPIKLFKRGDEYRLLGLIKTNVHFLGVDEPGMLFLLGTDKMGRDMYSRILHASRISLTIGLVGVSISFVLGCLLGGVSGYFGGAPDMLIQRIIEFLGYVPQYATPRTSGERIVTARRLLGLTQKKLARRLGIDPSTLGRWERGEGRPSKRLWER